MAIYNTWIRIDDYLPSEGQRVLVFSPAYKKGDPMRLRMMDAQFVKISTEATHWMLAGEPT